jgi:hypothetical protein
MYCGVSDSWDTPFGGGLELSGNVIFFFMLRRLRHRNRKKSLRLL